MLSVLIPSYNEEEYIADSLEKMIRELESLGTDYELIVVEESTDRTPGIVGALAKKYHRLRHLHFDKRLGKGGALEKGIEAAKGSRIVFTDADLSTDLSSLRDIARQLDDCDIVLGSRYHPLSRSDRTILRLLLSRAYSVCVRALLGIRRPQDLQCGMKGFRRSAALKILPAVRNKGFFWDTEFLFHAKRLGYRIGEVPVIWVEKRVRGSGSGKLKNIIYMGKSLLKLFARSLLG
ncbi:MAG: glycosyltransferase [Candidatus Aenigmarchaeota archaeon]|nr:glycosyltransferase [Candidatus Aenigmarchaeota archaeon]